MIVTILVTAAGAQTPHWSSARGGMVATVHPLATAAGVESLQQGGNAMMLGVVDGHNSGLGGGCFILIRTAAGELLALDARETAPAAASRDMYVREGAVVPELSRTGPLAVATPGAVAGYHSALERCGVLDRRFPWLRAAAGAESGVSVQASYASNLRSHPGDLRKFP